MAKPYLTYDTPQYPRQLRLDVTTACNARCLSCHKPKSKRVGVMTLDVAIDILKNVSKWPQPLTELIPVNHGEFFLYGLDPQGEHNDWAQLLMVTQMLLPNTQIVIPTNGAMVDDMVVGVLKDVQTLKIINFSVNAFFSDTYEQFTGLRACTMKQIQDSIISLRVMRPDLTIWISMVYDPVYQTEKEKELFIQHWGQYGIPQVIPASNCARHTQQIRTTLPCRSIFSDLVIGYDGKISSCCFDSDFSIDLGVYKGDVLEAWHNSKLEKLRKMHNDGRRQEIPLCRNCSFA